MFFIKKNGVGKLNNELPISTPLENVTFTVFDTETTGFEIAKDDRLIEIGAVIVRGYQVEEKRFFQSFVNPERNISTEIVELTGINEDQVKSAPDSIEVIENFLNYVEKEECVALVGHYVEFDLLVLKHELKRGKKSLNRLTSVDTLDLIGYVAPSYDMRDLERYAMAFGTRMYERHRAMGDALTTAYLFVELLEQLRDRGLTTWGDLLRISAKHV